MQENLTLTFDSFWIWLTRHPNCILRAGTPETVLYDDEDLHWHFGTEDPGTLVVQLIRGKRMLGELLIASEPIVYVEGTRGDHDEEFVFELIVETPDDRMSAYFFVLAHGFDVEEEDPTPRRVH
jgi:hypothetical protein